jgi:hypothetical protein
MRSNVGQQTIHKATEHGANKISESRLCNGWQRGAQRSTHVLVKRWPAQCTNEGAAAEQAQREHKRKG